MLLLLFQVQIEGRELSRKGRDLIGAEVASKNCIFHRLRKQGDHGDSLGQVFRFGGIHVEIVRVPLIVQITDVRGDKGVE